MVVSPAFGFFAEAAGHQVIFLVIAGLLLAPLWFVGRVREPVRRAPAPISDRRAFRVMLEPRCLLSALFLVLNRFLLQGIDRFVIYWMSDTPGSSSLW